MPAYERIKLDLSGSLPLGEKMKQLNKFIAQAKESEVNNILRDCKGLPDTLLNLLKLLLADKFHHYDLIIELLREGDTATLSGAVAKRWLYKGEDSKLVDSEYLINELFPNVSYNCRQKVLYRIGRFVQNEGKADKIWNAVEQRYGFDVAFPILPACSKAKISSIIASKKVNLSGPQLVQILQKFPDVGMEYLKKHYANVGTSKNSYRSPLYYLYEHRLNDFLDLCINYPGKIFLFSFGRGRSTKIIRACRQKLLENPTKFRYILKLDRIRREFSNEEFQILFESSLASMAPAYVCSSDVMWKWVRTVQINKRIEMVNQTFTKLFQINLDEHQDYMCPEYIVLLPDEKRLTVIQWKIENDTRNSWSWSSKDMRENYYDDEEKKLAWTLLKPTSHSVPELQKLLLIEQEVQKRATLSQYLIETCYINEDLSQLQNVLVLLSTRSRNDQCVVREVIFDTVNKIMKQMEFSKKHWDVIKEMIQVSQVFKDDYRCINTDKEEIVEKCLVFHIDFNLPCEELVSMYIKLKIQNDSSLWSNSYIRNAATKRTLLKLYAKELEHLQWTNNSSCYNGTTLKYKTFSKLILNLIEEICDFNSQAKLSEALHPISISSHPWLITSLEHITIEEEERFKKNNQNSAYDWKFPKRLVHIIETLRKQENLSLDFVNSNDFFSKMQPESSIIRKFRKNPSDLIKDWLMILSKVTKHKSTIKFLKKLKFWNYSIIVTHFIEMFSKIITQKVVEDSGATVEQKCNAVLALSVLSEPSDFLALTAEYYPPEKKVDVFVENSEEDYQIRQTFAKSLVNITTPHLTFPAIERFCVGDYLKVIVGCFYSQTGRAKELVSRNFLLQKIDNSAVSLRKHVIRQLYTISSVEDRCRILNEIDSSNVTIRYEVFIQANKLLRTSPSKETWNILKTIIEKTSPYDASIILFLHSTPKFETCPQEYISDYIITCFVILQKLAADKVEIFMKHLELVITKIPEKTLDYIILYKHADQVSFSSTFCAEYLKRSSSKSVLEYRLSNIWSLLQNIIRNDWDIKKTRTIHENSLEYPTRNLVWSFISSLCFERMYKSTLWLKNQIFQFLLAQFKFESLTKFIKFVLYLELSLLIVKEVENNGNAQLMSFGRSLARFTDSLVKIYGEGILYTFIDVVVQYVKQYFLYELRIDNFLILELIDGILETSKSRENQIVSISFLGDINPKTGTLAATFEKINAILSESEDTIVQMYHSLKSY